MAAHLERKAPAGLSKRETHDGSVADARRRLSKDDSGDRSHVTTPNSILAKASVPKRASLAVDGLRVFA